MWFSRQNVRATPFYEPIFKGQLTNSTFGLIVPFHSNYIKVFSFQWWITDIFHWVVATSESGERFKSQGEIVHFEPHEVLVQVFINNRTLVLSIGLVFKFTEMENCGENWDVYCENIFSILSLQWQDNKHIIYSTIKETLNRFSSPKINAME